MWQASDSRVWQGTDRPAGLLPGELDAQRSLAEARRLGLTNATFWRHFRDIAADIRHLASADTAPAGSGSLRPDRGKELADHNARLRREHDQLADQLEAALGHLRRLTIDNARLRRELEAARGITRIDPGRAPSQQT